MEDPLHDEALNLVLQQADAKHRHVDFTTFADFTLDDLGYDSLSTFELMMEVEKTMDKHGVTTNINDDRWHRGSMVLEVIADIVSLLEGRH